ncbi:caax beta [Stylonychia lemnae]|uniref:Protein farnesyltransferase subunit beta n=1 Tax=Stylonychia lemnae TaxID=5949 RepID=A0A078B710_STYLE|nr:caax beta [Stylonychia lemnae]|eukprot:CDW89353.1 caax beta [Stylonychia lemnae]
MSHEDPLTLMRLIKGMYHNFELDPPNAKDYDQEGVELFNDLHSEFVKRGFEKLPKGMSGLDSGQPWFIYWLTEALEVLNQEGFELNAEQKSRCVEYLRKCHNSEQGGFAGAPYHQSHLASSYAAVLAIVNIGTQEAFNIIDVEAMRRYLKSIKNNYRYENQGQRSGWNLIDQNGDLLKPTKVSEVIASLPGSVEIHINGEIDMRGVYCAMVIADILNLKDEEFTRGVGDFVASCQTYEGGISCVPLGEAHGGYTFCGLAALVILNETHKLNLDRLIDWLAQRQLTEEGGFNGRINKLVDSCYNFWQGASFELFDIALKGNGNVNGELLFNQEALQAYTVICCQEKNGGLKDKPTKTPDYYHTCYAASGMSIAQHLSDYESLHSGIEGKDISATFNGNYNQLSSQSKEGEEFKSSEQQDSQKPATQDKKIYISGIEQSQLRRINPIFNTRYDFVAKAKAYYKQKSQ